MKLKRTLDIPLEICKPHIRHVIKVMMPSVVRNRPTQDTSQKSQGKFFLLFLSTLFLYFQDLKKYKLRLLRSDLGSVYFPLVSFLQYLNNYIGILFK